MSYLRAGIVLAAVICSQTAGADAGIYGRYLTDDKDSVVSIEPCKGSLSEVCGYLAGFVPSGNEQLDRALCGYRLLGGLRRAGKKFKGGWLLDIETGSAYKLSLRPTEDGAVKVIVFETIESLNETFIWERYKQTTAASGSLRICAADKSEQ